MELTEVIKRPEYKEIVEDKRNILLTFGGSISYGTNLEGSDIDIRGIKLNTIEQLLGLENFEQTCYTDTDTTIYGLTKVFRLLINCNPNVIEMLYTLPEHRITNELGNLLISQRDLFLSQLSIKSFNGYACNQLHRLKNALILNNKIDIQEELNYHQSKLDNCIINFSKNKDLESSFEFFSANEKLYLNADIKDYPVSDLVSLFSEINSILASWNKIEELKNRELDIKRLNKHAMHLIRIYLMGLDILEGRELSTYRKDTEHSLLMDIRNGKYLKSDNSYDSAFFDMVSEYQKKLDYAKLHTELPKLPNLKKIQDLLIYLNEQSL